MKMRKKKYLSALLALSSVVGCQAEKFDIPSDGNKFCVKVAPFENGYGSASRSAFFSESSQKVTDLNVWVYESATGLLANTGRDEPSGLEYKSYFSGTEELDGDSLFPDMGTEYDIYIFTNTGQIDPPATKRQAEDYKYTFDSYDSFVTVGFPMAAHYRFVPSDPSVDHRLKVYRLVSRYSISIECIEADLLLTSVEVKSSARVIRPFAPSSKASSVGEVMENGDKLNLKLLSSPGGCDLYMLENMQGEVFSNPYERSFYDISPEARQVATYLEFKGTYDYGDGSGYKNTTFRYYFGKDRNADIVRNYHTELTLRIRHIDDYDDWRVELGEYYSKPEILSSSHRLEYTDADGYLQFQLTPAVNGKEYASPSSPEAVAMPYCLDFDVSLPQKLGVKIVYDNNGVTTWMPYTGQELVGQATFRISFDSRTYPDWDNGIIVFQPKSWPDKSDMGRSIRFVNSRTGSRHKPVFEAYYTCRHEKIAGGRHRIGENLYLSATKDGKQYRYPNFYMKSSSDGDFHGPYGSYARTTELDYFNGFGSADLDPGNPKFDRMTLLEVEVEGISYEILYNENSFSKISVERKEE